MINTMESTKQPTIRERHEFGRGIIRELAKSAFKEAVSNALDEQPKNDARIDIYTDVLFDIYIVVQMGT